ncbi:unnamed protein product [Calypogeia fissa]
MFNESRTMAQTVVDTKVILLTRADTAALRAIFLQSTDCVPKKATALERGGRDARCPLKQMQQRKKSEEGISTETRDMALCERKEFTEERGDAADTDHEKAWD